MYKIKISFQIIAGATAPPLPLLDDAYVKDCRDKILKIKTNHSDIMGYFPLKVYKIEILKTMGTGNPII
jgi:hypothetical protein